MVRTIAGKMIYLIYLKKVLKVNPSKISPKDKENFIDSILWDQ